MERTIYFESQVICGVFPVNDHSANSNAIARDGTDDFESPIYGKALLKLWEGKINHSIGEKYDRDGII